MATFQVEYHAKRAYHRRGEPRSLRQKPKHQANIHVWGGISKRGTTELVLFKDTMTVTRYTSIFEAAFLPFVCSTFPDSHRFYQDNDPKHMS